jgi:hypothetical protein
MEKQELKRMLNREGRIKIREINNDWTEEEQTTIN